MGELETEHQHSKMCISGRSIGFCGQDKYEGEKIRSIETK